MHTIKSLGLTFKTEINTGNYFFNLYEDLVIRSAKMSWRIYNNKNNRKDQHIPNAPFHWLIPNSSIFICTGIYNDSHPLQNGKAISQKWNVVAAERRGAQKQLV